MQDIKERVELKSCPFCGEKPIVDGKSEHLSIRCEGCGVQGASFYFGEDWEVEGERQELLAIKVWNSRIEIKELQEREAKLVEAIKYIDNKIYMLERGSEDEISLRYQYEIMKIRATLQSLGE